MNAIVVSEPHLLIRKGLVAIVELVGPNRVTAECQDILAVLNLVSAHHPQLLVVSAEACCHTFGESLVALKRHHPFLRILVLCETGSTGCARAAIDAGCEGVIRKDAGWDDLTRAIADVLQGRSYVDPELARKLVQMDRQPEPLDVALGRLTARERVAFTMLARGHSNRSAAEAMSISVKTIEKHRASLMQKLNLRDGVDIRMLGIELGVYRRTEPAQRQ